MVKHLPLLVSCLFLLLPVAVWFERTENETWQHRLIIPFLISEPDRHTPIQSIGTFLPPIIDSNLTLSEKDSPILLTSATIIAPHVTLRLLPGSSLYAHEFATLTVQGTLIAEGTNIHPITFTTNEQHPDNQIWNGLIFTPESRGQFTYTFFQYATPAITCEEKSRVDLTHITIEQTLNGLFTRSPNCAITNSRINSMRDGITALHVSPSVINTVIHAARTPILTKF